MSEKKTIAIQADDPNFIAQYEERVKQSGKTVKNYLMGLIWADIKNPDQAFKTASAHSIDMSAIFDDPGLSAHFQDRLDQSGKSQEEYFADIIRADAAQAAQAAMMVSDQESTETPAQGQVAEPVTDQESKETPVQDQVAETVTGQVSGEIPSQDTEITNLFVKITKEQREALDNMKNETGEPVGKILNRLIDDFLDTVRNGSFAEDFEETYQQYEAIAGECDTTCSAKIPSQNNKELFEYLESTGKSRNVLMACLVHLELDSQCMEEEQGQGMAMQI